MERLKEIYDNIQYMYDNKELNGTIHLGRGQEAVDKGFIDACPDGFFVGNHRSLGQYLQFKEEEDLIKAIKKHENQHLYIPDKLITAAIQGSLCPFAVGTAFAFKKKGINRPVVCFIGDGTLGQGSFYEALNLAALFNPNITFVIIDNRYSMSHTDVWYEHQYLASYLRLRYAEIYEGNIYNKVYTSAKSWFEGKGAGIIYVTVERLCGHSCSDTQRYRPKEELTQEYIQKHEVRDK